MGFLDKYKIKEEEEEFNEIEFQKAYKEYAIQQGLSEDPDDPRHFYDYRAYYKKYKKFEVDEFGHLSSEFKEKGHPRRIVEGVDTKTGKSIEEEFSFLNKYKFTPIEPITPVETGIGAKAVGGATLPKPVEVPSYYGISDVTTPEKLSGIEKGIISLFGTWEAKKRAMPELQKMEDFANLIIGEAVPLAKSRYGEDYSKRGSAIEEVAVIYEYITGTPKEETLKDIEGIKDRNIFFTSPPEKYKEAVKLKQQLSDIRMRVAEPGKDIIGQFGWSGMVAMMGSQVIAGLMKITPELWRKLNVKVVDKKIPFKEGLEAIRKIGEPAQYGKGTAYQRKIFNEAIKKADVENISIVNMLKKGLTITETQPRFAFGDKLYAGVPIDEMVKSIVEVGKITKDIANQLKVMNPVDTGLVFQQLSIASPAIASKVASQFVELIPQEITKIPKVEEEMTKEEVEQFEKLKEAKIIPEEEIEPTKVELKEIELTPKEKFMARMEEVRKKPVEKVVETIPIEPVKPVEPKIEVEPKIDLATPVQIKKAHTIANTKAMISEKGKVKPQYRAVAKGMTGKTSVKDMTPEEAEMFIDALDRLPEPKYKAGKLVAPTIPRTMKLTVEGFFQKKYGEPTPIWLLTDQTYYATKLGIKPLIEPFEKGKMEFDLEFRKSSNLVDRMVNKLNSIAKTSAFAKIKSKVKNVPTKAESKMAELINKHEATPPGLSPKEEDVFKYFRNLSKDIWRRENEVREKVDLPPIKYKQAYFRHTADVMAKEMLEGKYPFPQGIKYWSEKMVGEKIFNPMEFHRKLSDDLIDIWSKDIRAVTKAMLWSGLKEIYLAEPAKFLNEQLNAISKDLPEYKNLSPRDQAAYDQTRVMPASTKKWLVNYINQVIKGQETELDASLNRIVTKSGLKGIFDKVLSPFGRNVGRKPITNIFVLGGRAVISGVMGWVPRQIMRNSFQPVQNLALYGVKATIKAYLPASVDKNLKGLLSESLFLKSYTGFEELPTNLMAKLEKVWLGPYGIVAVNNAKLGMKAAYWNILELIKNPKFKKHGWADPQRTKDTPKGFLYPSEKEKLLREMEFGASATQYQYIPIGMPGVFRYKALVPLTRLQSWWMNYFTKFTREAIHRGFKGRPSWSGEDGPTLPWSRRINYLKYVIIGGSILTALGYRRSFMLGVLPVYISPAGQVALGMYNYATATEDWQKKRALSQIYYSWKAFIPGSLAWRDFLAVWKGEKELNEILFYGKKEEEKEKKKAPSPYLDKYKEETTAPSSYLQKYKR